MKIWYDDIVYSLQKAGGISTLWKHTTAHVPFDVYRIRYKGSKDNIFCEENSHHKYRMHRNFFLKLGRYFNPLLINEKEPFLFHSSYYRFCKNPKAINITTVHDFVYELYIKGLRTVVHRMQKRRAIMHSDAVICISKSTKNDLLRFYPNYNGIIKVVYNGYDTDKFYNQNSKKMLIVLSVGERSGYKRFDLTVALVKRLTECRLLIIGGGALNKKELNLLEREIPGRYEKRGLVLDDELRDIYNSAFFLSYCSDYEGFGIPPLEAQACGCPVVCQAKSSLPEVMGKSAIFIDPDDIDKSMDSINRLFDEQFYKEIVEMGLDNVKRFSFNKCQEEVISLYQSVLKQKGIRING